MLATVSTLLLLLRRRLSPSPSSSQTFSPVGPVSIESRVGVSIIYNCISNPSVAQRRLLLLLLRFSFTYREPQQIEYAMQEEHMQLQEDSDGGGSTSSGAGGDRVYSEDLMQQSEKGSSGGQQKRGGMVVDDKKMRRQIANSNERRRMQSINAGFQSLRNQLPHHEGEKLSKVGGWDGMG